MTTKQNETDQNADRQPHAVVSERTYDWNGKTRQITRPDFDDVEVASRVRMVTGSDLDHEFVCVLGRDRIMALVKEKEALKDAMREVAGLVETESTILDHVGARGSSIAMAQAAVKLREAASSH